MHMIRNPADAIRLAPRIAGDRGEECVQPRPRISIQQRRTILRAENDVDDD
jgi:hypothetical protein